MVYEVEAYYRHSRYRNGWVHALYPFIPVLQGVWVQAQVVQRHGVVRNLGQVADGWLAFVTKPSDCPTYREIHVRVIPGLHDSSVGDSRAESIDYRIFFRIGEL